MPRSSVDEGKRDGQQAAVLALPTNARFQHRSQRPEVGMVDCEGIASDVCF